jgi:hypothetical protein
MTNNNETGAAALAKLSFALVSKPTAEDIAIQEGIQRTMAEVVRTRGYNPNALSPPVKVTPVGAVRVAEPKEPVRGTGWQDEIPLREPPGQDLIERLTNTALPHGPLHGRVETKE